MTNNSEQTEKTSAQIVAERILSMKLDKDYKAVPNLPIPLDIGVLVMKLTKPPAIIKIETDLLSGNQNATQEIYTATGDNSREPNLGILMAVGPKCSEYLRVGLRVFWDVNQTGTFRHKGVDYYRMDQYSILYIVPDASTLDTIGDTVKDERQVRREKKIPQQQDIANKLHKRDMNELDEKTEKSKSKKSKNTFLN